MYSKGLPIRQIVAFDFFVAKTARERIIFLLKYAILAPSTHNSQPWLFRIENDSCKIYFDEKAYAIKEADPLQRDLYISFGCLIENLVTAAEYFGVLSNIEYANVDNLVATVTFKNLTSVTAPARADMAPLITAILERVNARGLFEKNEVSSEVIEQFKKIPHSPDINLHLVTDPTKRERLASLTAEGLREAYHSRTFREEMSTWVSHSLSSRKDGIPGYSLRMPFLLSFIFPWLLKNKDIGGKVGKLNYISAASAPLIFIFTAKENSRTNWLETGRLAQKIMLQARVVGLKTSIFVASVEIGNLYKKVQDIISTNEIPQLLMCAGEMRFRQKPNLRHPVEEKLI